MKKKKLISAIILFGLTLSSCKGCNKDKHDTLDRNTSALKEYEELTKDFPDTRVKEIVRLASKAIEHATGVINGTSFANSEAILADVAIANAAIYADATKIHSKVVRTADVAVAIAVAAQVARTLSAFKTITYLGYVAFVVFNINFAAAPNVFTAADAAKALDYVRKAAAIAATTARAADAETPAFVRTIIADAVRDTNELLKKVNELEERFEIWRISHGT